MTSMAAPSKTPATSPGEISPDTLYTLEEISRRTGLGRHSLRAARRQGLAVRYVHNRGYVIGRDVIQYLLDAGTVGSRAHIS